MDLPTLDGDLTDGVVVVRPGDRADAEALRVGFDAVARHFLGTGEPDPLAVIAYGGEIVGWIDWDAEREWLGPDEVNLGYAIVPEHRGRGFARRALDLIVNNLAGNGVAATLLIDPTNSASIAVADRVGFERTGEVGDQLLFRHRG